MSHMEHSRPHSAAPRLRASIQPIVQASTDGDFHDGSGSPSAVVLRQPLCNFARTDTESTLPRSGGIVNLPERISKAFSQGKPEATKMEEGPLDGGDIAGEPAIGRTASVICSCVPG